MFVCIQTISRRLLKTINSRPLRGEPKAREQGRNDY